jgi:predicted secreted protein
MLVLDDSQNNGAAEVTVGDQFQVQLYENPTTGHCWHLRQIDNAGCRVLEEAFETSHGGYGGGGIRRWTFVADRVAVAALHMELRPSGQLQPARTFDVTVDIRDR